MARRLEARLLKKHGKKQKDVAVISGISERSIRRIEREAPIENFDDALERKRRKVGRPSKVATWLPEIQKLLSNEPTLPSGEVFRLIRESGFAGGKTAVYDAIAELRPKDAKPIVRFEGLAGEFSQHDFGEVDVRFGDDRVERVHFFASRLKWSRWIAVTLTPDQTAESLVRALVGHFEAFGGVPLVAVFDRPKTIAIDWEKDGRVTKWNSTFLKVMGELSVAPELCWPYQPRQKGAVENLVGWVKKSFFSCRRFVDHDDLRRQLTGWLEEMNSVRESRATGATPASRMPAERARMRELKLKSDHLTLPFPVQVDRDGTVIHDGRRYSMPPNAIGLAGTLYLGTTKVRIVAGKWEANHPRLTGDARESTLPEHRVAMVNAVPSPRAKLFVKREHVLDLGPEAEEFLTELVHRRPKQWDSDVEQLHELLLLHGDKRVRAAIHEACVRKTWGAEYVAHFLGERERMARLSTRGEEVSQ